MLRAPRQPSEHRPRGGARVAILAACAAIAVAAASFALLSMRSGPAINNERVNTAAQLLQGLATVGAVMVALRGIAVERQRARADREAVRDRQATQVFAWLAPHGGQAGKRRWYLCFENHTEVPIYEWQVAFGDSSGHLCGERLGPLRPKSSELLLPDLTDLTHNEVPRPTLVFVDAYSRVWTRDERGRTSLQNDMPDCCGNAAKPMQEGLTAWRA